MSRGVAALLVAAACAGSNGGPAATGTVVGAVEVGPFCPVEVEGEPCPPPPGTYDRIAVAARPARAASPVVRATPDETGRYRMTLAVGRWRLGVEHDFGPGPGGSEERVVDVESGAVTTVDFSIDTGIR